MLPRCVVDSPAYRDLSVHARAVLVEIGVRLDGYNNGRIGIDQRSIVESLRCAPRKVVVAIAELMSHGMIDVTFEGDRVGRKAREYRLTFVSTPTAPATNDYLRWTPETPTAEKITGSGAVAEGGCSASGAVATPTAPASGAVARLNDHRRKTAISQNSTASGAVAHIIKPCVGAEPIPAHPLISAPPFSGGPSSRRPEPPLRKLRAGLRSGSG